MHKKFDIKEFAIIPPPYGGVSVFVKRLIYQLSQDGYKVGGYYISDVSQSKIYDSILFDEWSWIETLKFPFKVWKYLKDIYKYQIVHSHFSLEGMIYLWTFKTICRKKIVVTVHNSMVANYLHNTNLINRFFLKQMFKSNVQWIAVSEQTKQEMENLPLIIKNPIHVIPAYIPDLTTNYDELSSSFLDYLNQHKQNIAFYGHSFMTNGTTDVYGFYTVIESYFELLKRRESLGLVICLSDTQEKDKIQELHKLAKKYNLDNQIYWQIGPLDNMKKLWERVHIYFRPTSTDGDSVAVREALDEGVVVVASDSAFRPKGVIQYKYGSLEDAVEKLLFALDLPKRKAAPNMKYYEEMKSIYDNLLNCRK